MEAALASILVQCSVNSGYCRSFRRLHAARATIPIPIKTSVFGSGTASAAGLSRRVVPVGTLIVKSALCKKSANPVFAGLRGAIRRRRGTGC